MKQWIYKMILGLALFSFFDGLHCQAQVKESFPYLNWIMIQQSYTNDIPFGYPNKYFTLIQKDCKQLPNNHPCYDEKNTWEYLLIGSYQNDNMPAPMYVLFSPGPSCDPIFKIVNNNGRVIWQVGADEMGLTENGTIYVAGHTNNVFNQRAKYYIREDYITEARQPYHYVGMKGKTLRPIKLYERKIGGEPIVSLPKGYEIEVLLAETSPGEDNYPRHYLVRTAFGLVGWLILSEKELFEEPVLNTLRYYGD